MAVKCGATNPEDRTKTCINKGPHAAHWDGDGYWPNTETVEREALRKAHAPGKSKKGSLAAALGSVAQVRNENLAAERGVSTGVPQEAVGKWLEDEWVTYAGQTLTDFLKSHPEPFTTAEDLWPLLDKPEEMRALSIVIQRTLRAQWMEEVGSKRLRGVYRTKDGHEFAENKLVPIYQSRISTALATKSDSLQT